ncbi:hypothetical protein NPIL_702031 [Nephila pilipes]|uniref:Uncharacterized protein n=1 Tax=Nephila pilipes TaxID=299642 RepID=A0A8X6Q638_NEPPI|nr:hypothetical protein NPIL_702031 [Nephila pilipes]
MNNGLMLLNQDKLKEALVVYREEHEDLNHIHDSDIDEIQKVETMIEDLKIHMTMANFEIRSSAADLNDDITTKRSLLTAFENINGKGRCITLQKMVMGTP